MYLYKCEECGLLISDNFQVCPKCNSERNKLYTNTDNIEEVVYKLTMEDVEDVIKQMNIDDQKKIMSFKKDVIFDTILRKIEIPYIEYIESTLERLL